MKDDTALRLNALSWAFVRFFEQHAGVLANLSGWDDMSLAFHANASREAELNAPRSERRAPEGWGAKSKDDKDALASACLAFAAMLKEDYGVGKQAALTCITAAYETNEAAK